jgi:hypothetical protein
MFMDSRHLIAHLIALLGAVIAHQLSERWCATLDD